jgi:hypothetical protein
VVTLTELAQLWRKLGKPVVEREGVLWFADKPNGVYYTYPYEQVLETPASRIRGLLWEQRGLLARVTRAPSTPGFDALLYICDDHAYDVPKLPKHRRSVVRKGLKQAAFIGKLERDVVLRDGLELEFESLKRQGRNPDKLARADWEAFMAPFFETDDAYCWGALHAGRVVAFILMLHVNDEALIFWHRSGGAAMNSGINNAMVYELVRHTIVSGDMRHISYGLGSVRDLSTLDWFKQTMGFQAIRIRQEFVPHPVLRPLLARPLLRLAGRTIRKVTRNDFALKIAGAMDLFTGDAAPATEEDPQDT